MSKIHQDTPYQREEVRMTDFNDYRSSSSNRSIFNNIPMALRNDPFVKGMEAAGCRIVYRGPRTNPNTNGTLKKDARRFSIYPPSQRYDHILQKRVWPWEPNGYDLTLRMIDEVMVGSHSKWRHFEYSWY